MSEALTTRLAEVFNEPDCARNLAKDPASRRKGCSQGATPGTSAGGCAFDGAKICLQPITDVVHLVHGPLACEGNSWDNRNAASSGARLYRRSFTTDLSELDIVMGNGEKRLYKAIGAAIERFSPAAVFVYQTCVTATIGDDIVAVCAHAAQRFGVPCIPVEAPGFAGSKNLGNKLAGEALLEHVIGTAEPQTRGACDINLIGEYNLCGELWQIMPLFDALGIRVLARISGDSRYQEIACAHRARVNLLVCASAMVNLARKLRERYGIPYFEGSFYGISDTSEALRSVARLLVERGAERALIARSEALIASEEARAWARIERYRPLLAGKRVMLYTGGVKSWSIVAALQEVGMVIVSTSVRKSTDEDKHRIAELMDEPKTVGNVPPREMYAQLARGDADILLSGGKSQFVALKAKLPWLDINQERVHAYAGYDGMVRLVEELARALGNPVWTELRRAPPWSQAAGT